MFGGFSANSGANDKVQFVAGNYSGAQDSDDDMFCDEPNVVLTRSSPTPHLLAVAPVARVAEIKEEAMPYDGAMVNVEYSTTVKTVIVPAVKPNDATGGFSSISDRFPLSRVGKVSCGMTRQVLCTPQVPKVQITAPIPMSRLLNATPELTQEDQMTVLVEDGTVDENTIKAEPEGATTTTFVAGANHMQQMPVSDVYKYQATDVEENEMEQLRWNIQEQVFQRYFEQGQKFEEWGHLEEKDSRVFFVAGERRENIMAEKRFHDNAVRDAMGKGNATWVKERRDRFEAEIRRFYHDETRHKQELMLTRLEKVSPFSKFPILGNRFLLLRLRGKGGNGEVWDVVDYANSKQLCALKLSTSIRHAQREHHTHSKLNHPNIVQVGEAPFLIRYQQQQYTAFTVASVESDLQQLIEMYEHFDDDSAYKVLSQLLNALKYLHEDMGVAHYDLKPSNILIAQGGCVQLTDFDLTRDAKAATSNSTVGTLRYLPPECFRPNRSDCEATAEKADMWMVGIVYCMMVTGKHPICPDKSMHAEVKAMMAQYTGELRYARPISDLSRWILQGCLHPDPRCRPTAAQLLVALQNVVPVQQ
ncbi:serine/threonine protein kinase [Phytophthora nicotianae CJ01A1]|uniref:Serine/threonine protein kinase n=3 Tax=Phytophthora nicotianae TaxID=4792 RepID=W2QV04_PHYN3|nr:serine/threonine protein kinase [Phytophthora nicotianae INRA-310]ETL25100.1 serine/threonine protein kinase [Phytophthora nicotianae]ETN16289.1 serine/threonine protein kinase [Phytophthora nicotianae INRA-310]ETP01098.1 serine/threonine protein kinase [Phytophthora nicotianae CJ01A1]